jgi:DNA polymerase epsilon subunit 2
MLSRDPEGRLCLEDGEGTVVLDMEDAVRPPLLSRITVGPGPGWLTPSELVHDAQEPGEGLFTENCLVLVEGEYTAEETIKVLAMGHPPSERREAARSV